MALPSVPAYVFVLITVGWMAWSSPFFLIRRKGAKAQTVDRRARWGIVLEGVGFFLVWQRWFWIPSPWPWRLAGAVLFLALAVTLSWTSARTLGRQWRFDAGLNADHQLVRSGAYRFVRHPIYASMLCMLIGTGLLVTRVFLLAPAIAFFIAGTEIRVRIEDRLLAERFGEEFHQYQRTVPAYLPFVR